MSCGDLQKAGGSEPAGMKVLKADCNIDYVKVDLNQVYADKDEATLHLQILTPQTGRERYPLVVFVQGSGWGKQILGLQLHGLCEFAARGYIVAIVEYRPSYISPFPAQIKDFKTAVRFLQEHAREYQIDTERIYAWGDSSGGHTILMSALTMEQMYNDEDGELNIKGFIDFYGPTDLLSIRRQSETQDHTSAKSPVGMLLGGYPLDDRLELAQTASPVHYIEQAKEVRPVLIMHGDKDEIVPFEQSVQFYEKMRAYGKDVRFYKLQGAGHGGDAFLKQPVLDVIEGFINEIR